MSNLMKKGLAMLLAVLMLAALLPATALAEGDAENPADAYVNGKDTQPDDLQDEEDLWDCLFMSGADDTDQIAVYEVTHNYTNITSDTTLSGTQTCEYLLSGNITVTLKNLEIDLSAEAGKSPITLADGANVTLVISGTVTLKGGNARSTTGAGAAIRVPESATLTILSAHDDRSDADANGKPKDTLAVYGGNAAPGRDGIDADAYQAFTTKSATTILKVGGGGSGGGGAAAAIGGNGGDGGAGGSYTAPTFTNNQKIDGLPVSIAPVDIESPVTKTDDGKVGLSGEVTGTIRVVGFLNLKGSGGLAAAGGNGGYGAHSIWTDRIRKAVGSRIPQITVISGPGGGGGGGLPAPFIGCGGAGGSGGGSGGAMRVGFFAEGGTLERAGWYSGNGGGGWPNGGGGSGSGSGSGGSTRPTASQTGDTFQPLVWCGALALSAAGMAVCRQLRRKDA